MKVLDMMEMRNINLTIEAYNPLLSYMANRGEVKKAEYIIDRCRARDISPDAVSYAQLAKAYGTLG
eukprot:CAMPEP_0119153470 /NCGR_PEP_ID=MMETSP1310-20130426/49306_1 /TAXON_ID=464262 /ORGANISM="Genus nov. species nov., Strain RCC2339" /LENGTH=65 /DNA_ID=CAMNT_0007145925 /DNA_START=20 /DNA_END=213 /DNA_ORIENTATION=+